MKKTHFASIIFLRVLFSVIDSDISESGSRVSNRSSMNRFVALSFHSETNDCDWSEKKENRWRGSIQKDVRKEKGVDEL